MIYVINDIADPLLGLIKDDPVRKDIYPIERITGNKEILVWLIENDPEAVLCVSYQDHVPENEKDLISSENPSIAIFYTVWSYKPRSGKKLIFAAKEYIKEHRPNIKRFITLSPKTDMAHKFHTFNGAKILSENENSINYEYTY